MPDSDVVKLIRDQKAKLLAREAEQMRAMVKRWLEVEKSLEAEMLALALEMSEEKVITEAMILRNKRFEKLLYQARAQAAKYADYAEELISEMQAELAARGIDDAVKVLNLTIKDAQIASVFDMLPVDALNALFGMAGDGSPLRNLLMKSYGESVNGLMDALIKGLALGKHPTETAKMMADAFGINLQRALTIARTEQLRAYRAGTMEQYRTSGIVNGYKRMATKDSRTCIGCLFADGTRINSLDGEFDEHPNGRCTAVPIVDGANEPTWQSGMDWFKKQSESVQKEMMGAQRFDAWQSGVSLESMSTLSNDPTWGGSYKPTAIKDL